MATADVDVERKSKSAKSVSKKPTAARSKPKAAEGSNKPKSRKKISRCSKCNIAYQSTQDDIFRKGRQRQTSWIGCDKSACDYWAHASCVNLLIKPKVPVEKHKFLCLNHR